MSLPVRRADMRIDRKRSSLSRPARPAQHAYAQDEIE